MEWKIDAGDVADGLVPTTSGEILLDGNPSAANNQDYRKLVRSVYRCLAVDQLLGPRATANPQLVEAAGAAEKACKLVSNGPLLTRLSKGRKRVALFAGAGRRTRYYPAG